MVAILRAGALSPARGGDDFLRRRLFSPDRVRRTPRIGTIRPVNPTGASIATGTTGKVCQRKRLLAAKSAAHAAAGAVEGTACVLTEALDGERVRRTTTRKGAPAEDGGALAFLASMPLPPGEIVA